LKIGGHNSGVELSISKGRVGETYCFGGECEMHNIDISNKICEILDEIQPRKDGASYKKQIKFVEDRKGHDCRYAINNSKVKSQLQFSLNKSFNERLSETIGFYIKSKSDVL